MNKLLGKITFECEVNGKIEMTVAGKGSKVFTHTDVKYSKGAFSKDKDGNSYIEQSVIFALFGMLKEAQIAAGKS